MQRRRKIGLVVLGALILAALLVGAWMVDRRIRYERGERERHFVSVHFVAMVSLINPDPEEKVPEKLDELMESYAGGRESLLLKAFPDGLMYRRLNGGFELAEPSRRFVNLFQHDRLVASESEWPHWELTGQKALKYPGQTIPPNYLRTKTGPKLRD